MKFTKKSTLKPSFDNLNTAQVVFLTAKNAKSFKKKDVLKRFGFTGKKDDFVCIDGNKFIFGITGIKIADDWRLLGYKVGKELAKVKTIKKVFFKKDLPKNSKELIEGILLSDYSFTKYKTKKEKKKNITFHLSNFNQLKNIVKQATAAINAQNFARDLVNTPAEDMHQSSILKIVEDTFKKTSVKVEAYNEKKLIKLGMNAHVAVSRASIYKAMTIKLTYEPKKYDKNIVLVGKGLVYDTGGLNIKTGGHMLTMKIDKAGAMTYLALMQYISKMGSKNKITVYLALADNAIDGNAYRPDDVFTMKCGKNVHIGNTDAEGRLVLADNLTLAEEENPKLDEIYTAATLTGAAIAAFGNHSAALVGFNQKMKNKMIKAGKITDEIFVNAPFDKYMMKAMKHDIADLTNLSNTPGVQGCQTAGEFLTHALKKETQNKFLHCDFAGPVYASKPWGTNPKNATGFGVRTFIELFT